MRFIDYYFRLLEDGSIQMDHELIADKINLKDGDLFKAEIVDGVITFKKQATQTNLGRRLMFKLPHQEWLEKQPKHTQEWLNGQAIWHDSDLYKAMLVGMILGFLIGLIF